MADTYDGTSARFPYVTKSGNIASISINTSASGKLVCDVIWERYIEADSPDIPEVQEYLLTIMKPEAKLLDGGSYLEPDEKKRQILLKAIIDS